MFESIRNMVRLQRDTLGTFRELSRRGDHVFFRVGHVRMLLLNHPVLIKQVLVTKQKSFEKGAYIRRLKKNWLGSSLLTEEDPAIHRRSRRLAQPAFHPHRLEVYAQAMRQSAVRLSDSWKDGTEVDISAAMEQVTIDAVGASLFGASLHRNKQEVTEAILALLRIRTPLVATPWVRLKEAVGYKPAAHRKVIKRLDDFIYGMIAERKCDQMPSDDLLTMLVQAREESGGFDEQQIRNETAALLVAGFETSALGLGWAIQALDAQPALQEELGAEATNLSEFAWDSLPRLPRTAMFMDEVLRLYPPAWSLQRVAVEDVEIGDRRVPRGTIVLMSQFLTHRDPRFWPEPEVFNLDRWAPGVRKKAAEEFSYFPFGGGSRVCIGEHFARSEMIVVLAMLLKKWRFKLQERAGFQPKITLHPDRPVIARVSAVN